MTLSWFVYLVRCKDNSLYTGITTDIIKRIIKHNNGTGAKYTKTKRPVTLVYYENALNKSEASKREYAIKQFSKQEKELLIKVNLNMDNYYSHNVFYSIMLIERAIDSTEKNNKNVEELIANIAADERVIMALDKAVRETFPKYKSFLTQVLAEKYGPDYQSKINGIPSNKN